MAGKVATEINDYQSDDWLDGQEKWSRPTLPITFKTTYCPKLKDKHQKYRDKTSFIWWFQPIWKIFVKLDHFPNCRDENKNYLKPPPSSYCNSSPYWFFTIFPLNLTAPLAPSASLHQPQRSNRPRWIPHSQAPPNHPCRLWFQKKELLHQVTKCSTSHYRKFLQNFRCYKKILEKQNILFTKK